MQELKSIAFDGYNGMVTGGVTVCITASSGSSATHSGPMVLVMGASNELPKDNRSSDGK